MPMYPVDILKFLALTLLRNTSYDNLNKWIINKTDINAKNVLDSSEK